MLTVIGFETPPEVAVTVTVEGPVGVASELDVVQPSNPAPAINSRARVRYAGRARKCRNRCCPASQSAISPTSPVIATHGKYGADGSRRGEVGGRLDVVVIVSTVEPFTVPAAIVAGFSEQPAPVRPEATAQVNVMVAGNG